VLHDISLDEGLRWSAAAYLLLTRDLLLPVRLAVT